MDRTDPARTQPRPAPGLVTQGRFKESLSALQQGLVVDPNNANQIKEKTDTEACARKVERAAELLEQVGATGVAAARGEVCAAPVCFLPCRC